MADQQLNILITANADQADQVLSAVEAKVNAFAQAVRNAMNGFLNESSKQNTVHVKVKVERNSFNTLLRELNELRQGVTIPVTASWNFEKIRSDLDALRTQMERSPAGPQTGANATVASNPQASAFDMLADAIRRCGAEAVTASQTITTAFGGITYDQLGGASYDRLNGVLTSAVESIEYLKQEVLAAGTNTGNQAANIDATTDAVQRFRDIVNQLGSDSGYTAGITQLASSLNELAGIADRIAQSVASVQGILGVTAQTYSNATAPTEALADATGRLADQQERLNRATQTAQNNGTAEVTSQSTASTAAQRQNAEQAESFATQLERARDISNGLNSGFVNATRAIETMTREASTFSAVLGGAVGVVRLLVGVLRTALGIILRILRAVAQIYTGLAKISVGAVAGVISGLGKVVGLLAKVTAGVGSIIKDAFVAPFKMVKNLIEAVADKLKSLWNRFKSMFLRAIIRKAVNAIIKSIQEGFEAVESKSSALSTSLGTLKGAFKGIGAAIASAFTPVIVAASSAMYNLAVAIVDALNAVSAFFGTLFGVEYTVVTLTSNVEELGEAAGGAGKKAKAALADFDELNVLSQSGGGGGGGASTGFDITTIDSETIPNLLAKLFNEEKFYEAGQFVSNWISGLCDKIIDGIDNWDSVAVGTHIAQFFNGLNIANEDTGEAAFGRLGAAIGTLIYKSFEGIDAMLVELDGGAIGRSIVQFIESLTLSSKDSIGMLAKTIRDFIKLECDAAAEIFQPDTAVKLANAVVDVIKDTLNDTELWSKIGDTIKSMITWAFTFSATLVSRTEEDGSGATALGSAITTLLDHIELPKTLPMLVETIKNLLSAVITEVAGAITVDNVTEIATAIANAINTLFNAGNEESGGSTTFAKLGTTLATILNNTVLGLSAGISKLDGSGIGTAIGEFLNNITVNFNAQAFGEMLHDLIKNAIGFLIGNGKDGKGGLLNTTDFEAIGEKIRDFLNGLELGELGSGLGQTAKALIMAALNLAVGLLSDENEESGSTIVDGIVNFFNELSFSSVGINRFAKLGEKIHDILVQVFQTIFKATSEEASGKDVGEQFGIGDAIVALLNAATFSPEDLKPLIDALISVLKDALSKVFDVVGNFIDLWVTSRFRNINVTADMFDINMDDSEKAKLYAQITNEAMQLLDLNKDQRFKFAIEMSANLNKGMSWDEALEATMKTLFGNNWASDFKNKFVNVYTQLEYYGDFSSELANWLFNRVNGYGGGGTGGTVGYMVDIGVNIGLPPIDPTNKFIFDVMKDGHGSGDYDIDGNLQKGAWNNVLGYVAEKIVAGKDGKFSIFGDIKQGTWNNLFAYLAGRIYDKKGPGTYTINGNIAKGGSWNTTFEFIAEKIRQAKSGLYTILGDIKQGSWNTLFAYLAGKIYNGKGSGAYSILGNIAKGNTWNTIFAYVAQLLSGGKTGATFNITSGLGKTSKWDNNVNTVITAGKDGVITKTVEVSATATNGTTSGTLSSIFTTLSNLIGIQDKISKTVTATIEFGKNTSESKFNSVSKALGYTEKEQTIKLTADIAQNTIDTIKSLQSPLSDFAGIKTSNLSKTLKLVFDSKSTGTMDTWLNLGDALAKIKDKTAKVSVNYSEDKSVEDIKERFDLFDKLLKDKRVTAEAKITNASSGKDIYSDLGISDLKATVSLTASDNAFSTIVSKIKAAVETLTVKLDENGGGWKLSVAAGGGMFDTGSLILAGEAGPEVLANVGGATGIMNVQQMAAAVSNGVASAMSSQNRLLAEQNRLLLGLLKKELVISPSAELGQVLARSEALYGRV